MKIHRKFNNKYRQPVENENIHYYEGLTPKSDIKQEDYLLALSWALDNKEIKNVALTGPYGSGKSSILKSFQAKNKEQYKFLNISLASFKEKPEESEKYLEKSIVQQMFYKVKNSELPYSRFKKIKKSSFYSVLMNLTILAVVILLGMFLFKTDTFLAFFKDSYFKDTFTNGKFGEVVAALSLITLFIGLCLIILSKLWILIGQNIRLNKVSVANTTIETVQSDVHSVFDKYLDEIIYFFEETKYNVVIFEDIDRFDNIDIFESLRELNTLINSSDQINQRIVFIYAVKDDMFGSKVKNSDTNNYQIIDNLFSSRNRTKFFDFIVPTIPVINASNSGEMLLKRLEASPWGNEISRKFVYDITVYVDDMRILLNIINEFITYKKNLTRSQIKIDSQKLLGMIVYKNIYPIDFSKLQHRSGIVFDIIHHKKSKIIDKIIIKKKDEIDALKQSIKIAEKEALTNYEELEILYVSGIFQKQDYTITINGTGYNRNSNFTGFFKLLQDHPKSVSTNYYTFNKPSLADDLATLWGTKKNFFQRIQDIDNKSRDNQLKIKSRINTLQSEIIHTRSMSLKQIIRNNFDDVFQGEILDYKLLIFLLRNGYINEMYNNYITYFLPGSLAVEDMEFIQTIKNHDVLPITFNLTKIGEIIKRLHSEEYSQEGILNLDFVEYIMTNKNRHKLEYSLIIDHLVNTDNDYIAEFIINFLEKTRVPGPFLNTIIEKSSNFTDMLDLFHKEHYFQSIVLSIIKFGEEDNIAKANEDGEISRFAENCSTFLFLLDNLPKVKTFISRWNIKFTNLEFNKEQDELIQYIFKNNHFEINEHMLKSFLSYYGFEENLEFSHIINTELEPLISYIRLNIVDYINEIYPNLMGRDADETKILELINSKTLSLEHKRMVIQKSHVRFAEFKIIEDLEFWPELLPDKIEVSWNNIYHYCMEIGFDDKIIQFINTDSSYRRLMEDSEMIESNAIIELLNVFINDERINDEYIVGFVKICPEVSLMITGPISSKRIAALIHNGNILLSDKILGIVQNIDNDLFSRLVEKHYDDFYKEYDLDWLEPSNLIFLLESKHLDDNDKVNLLNDIKLEKYLMNKDSIQSIYRFLKSKLYRINISLLINILKTELTIKQKLHLLIVYIPGLDRDDITLSLEVLGNPYKLLSVSGKRPTLENSDINMKLVEQLDKVDYISSKKVAHKVIRVYNKKEN